MIDVSSWGRRGVHPHRVRRIGSAAQARELIPGEAPGLATGAQRSYGDVSLNTGGRLWDMRGMDALIGFDERSGLLSCEAGVELGTLQRVFAQRGWMLPVTPGTRHPTVGGSIANDVHGKNHHVAGTFGRHVERIELLRTDGETIVCGPELRPEWFAATVGGLGLTGVILSATLRLEQVVNPYMRVEHLVFQSLDEFFALARASDEPYTVSWIDITTDGGRRGVFSRGRRANEAEGLEFEAARRRRGGPGSRAGRSSSDTAKLRAPFTPPFSLVNRATLPAFNRGYFRLQAAGAGVHTVDYPEFFYPLDAVGDWNRMYGPRGFFQFQCAVPWDDAEAATAEMLREVSRSGQGSFLGVLKALGDVPSPGLLSYPLPGINFTVDFPDLGESTLRLLGALERIAVEAGGRMYPAKDSHMSRAQFRAGYPGLERFVEYRDPGITSDLARRLLDD